MPLRLVLVLMVLVGAAPAVATPAPGTAAPGELCRPAIRAAERAYGIPFALLAALGRVESGRRDPETGTFGPWPWTINAEGRGQFFPTKAEAIAEVRRLQARGVRSIDVGCMQVNLMHHPHAFATLEEAFDPARNADYAARFLVELQQRTNNWLQAAAHYHSQTPEFAEAYRAKVVAAWPEESRLPRPVGTPPAGGLAMATPIAPAVPGGPGRIISLGSSGRVLAGSAGRDLAAYRASPIPVSGRAPPRPWR
ncbi:lytic transglycosylase domain-containing protein [Elioraea sp.]|uniref:lytic transglycosylase domain-containing protein n=1 Tax=Elioraea sp. TaxID=2185103 RepID=UPI00307E040C